MTELSDAKRALARLATTDCIARARRATADLESAAEFRETGGVARLRRAIAAAEGRREARGRAALGEYEAFAAAARGERSGRGEQFRRGRDIPLGDHAERGHDDAGDPHR